MKELSLVNSRLDRRYDIRSLLGRGSYAEVYVAEDKLSSPQSPHRLVAIKALNVFLQDDLDSDLERTLVENFQNEALALDRVRHPNIISRFGHGTARDLYGVVFHYIVLEYLAGGDLQSYIKKHEPGLYQAFDFIEQLCAGLRHAHLQGIIHRDIKPQNLLLTSDLSTVKIADFGVARDLISESPITRVGTNIYAPPEHSPLTAVESGGFTGQISAASDIYSLAKSIYTLLSGEPPRGFANAPIVTLPPTIEEEEWAGDLLRVLKKATDSDPEARHRTIEEFWTEMQAVRSVVFDAEVSTLVRSRPAVPQPHVVRGYTPFPPSRPSFSEITGIDTRIRIPERINQNAEHKVGKIPITKDSLPVLVTPESGKNDVPIADQKARVSVKPRFRKRLVKLAATFAVMGTILAGMIYGVSNIMQNFGLLPEFQNPFRQQIAVANTDIYLRPSPNTDNEPIGLVTRNSKVRIVNSRNNWYQVDVIQQGRVRTQGVNAQRGWLNGKYITMERN